MSISYRAMMDSLYQLFFWEDTKPKKKKKSKEKKTPPTCALFVLWFHKYFYNIITFSNYETTSISTTHIIKCNYIDYLNRQCQNVLEARNHTTKCWFGKIFGT